MKKSKHKRAGGDSITTRAIIKIVSGEIERGWVEGSEAKSNALLSNTHARCKTQARAALTLTLRMIWRVLSSTNSTRTWNEESQHKERGGEGGGRLAQYGV